MTFPLFYSHCDSMRLPIQVLSYLLKFFNKNDLLSDTIFYLGRDHWTETTIVNMLFSEKLARETQKFRDIDMGPCPYYIPRLGYLDEKPREEYMGGCTTWELPNWKDNDSFEKLQYNSSCVVTLDPSDPEHPPPPLEPEPKPKKPAALRRKLFGIEVSYEESDSSSEEESDEEEKEVKTTKEETQKEETKTEDATEKVEQDEQKENKKEGETDKKDDKEQLPEDDGKTKIRFYFSDWEAVEMVPFTQNLRPVKTRWLSLCCTIEDNPKEEEWRVVATEKPLALRVSVSSTLPWYHILQNKLVTFDYKRNGKWTIVEEKFIKVAVAKKIRNEWKPWTVLERPDELQLEIHVTAFPLRSRVY